MKKLTVLCLFMMVAIFGQAKDSLRPDTLNDINAIKRDTSFIYAESTMKDAIEALSGAKSILELKLQDWLRNKRPNEDAAYLIEKSKSNWRNLLTQRGKYKRVFVFVPKKDVIPIVENTSSPDEASVVEQSSPVSNGAVAASGESITATEGVSASELTSDERAMAEIINFIEIEPFIKGLKENSRLRAYGKYASLPENDACYIFVYDRDGVIVAVLRQSEDGRHFNLRSKSDDNVKNYKNCGAIWLQLKN